MNLIRWQRPASHWPTLGRLTDIRDELDRLFESPLAELTGGSQLLVCRLDGAGISLTRAFKESHPRGNLPDFAPPNPP